MHYITLISTAQVKGRYVHVNQACAKCSEAIFWPFVIATYSRVRLLRTFDKNCAVMMEIGVTKCSNF